MTKYDLTLREYWRILKKRKLIVIITSLIMLVFSIFFAVFRAPVPLYTSTCSIKFEKGPPLEGLYEKTLSWSKGDNIQTQQAIITGYPVLTEVAKKLSLIPQKGSINDPGINAIIGELKSKVAVESEDHTSIIDISVTDRNPVFAQKMANEVAETYKRLHSEQQGRRTKKALKYIEDQLHSVRTKLKKSEEELNKFNQQNQLISTDLQSGNLLTRKEDIKDEIRKINADESEFRSLSARIKKYLKNPSSTDTNFYSTRANPQYQSANNSLVKLLFKKDSLLENFTEQHPKVISVSQKIVEKAHKMLMLLKLQIDTNEQRKKHLEKELHELNGNTDNLVEKKLEYDRLKREVDSFRNMTALLENKNQEALLGQSEKPEDVAIVRKALPSYTPINPPKTAATGIMGLIIGVVLGLVLAFLIETFDTSIGAIQDIEETLGIKVLGVIPHTDPKEILAGIKNVQIRKSDDSSHKKYINLVSHFAPKTMMAESFRALRTNIQFTGERDKAKIIAITSASPQEGKSIVSVNLSISLAQAGFKTLLVGADLRKSVLARIFGLEESPGLTELLLGSYPWKDTVKTVTDIIMGRMTTDEVIMTPGLDNLNIITGGTVPPNPAELIESKRLETFIGEAEQEYDFIIFDSTPVLSTADAAILGTKMDGVLIVYRVGAVSKGLLKRTFSQLEQVKCNIMGVILNGLKPDIGPDFPGYKHYRYYSYKGREESLQKEPPKGIFSFLPWKRIKNPAAHIKEPGISVKNKTKGLLFKVVFSITVIVALVAGIMWRSGILGSKKISSPDNMENQTATLSSGMKVSSPAIRHSAEINNPDTQPNNSVAEKAYHHKVVTQIPKPAAQKEKVKKSLEEYNAGPFPYSIYLGSYKTKETAEKAIDSYSGLKLPMFWVKHDFKKIGTWYRVYTGYFSTKTDAKKAIEEYNIKEAEIKKTPYTSLIGIYESKDRLQADFNRLKENNFCPYVLKDKNFILFSGAFYNRNNAVDLNNELHADGINSKVVDR